MDDRAKLLKEVQPHLIADVILYNANAGGKTLPADDVYYHCICTVLRTLKTEAFSANLQLEETDLHPGERRRVGFLFLAPEGAEVMRTASSFFLWWDGQFVGEAKVVR